MATAVRGVVDLSFYQITEEAGKRNFASDADADADEDADGDASTIVPVHYSITLCYSCCLLTLIPS